MIVVDAGDAFRMIAQYDHSLHAGEMGAWLRDEVFSAVERRASVLKAAAEHDLAWKAMDKVPMWNDARGAPYSFLDLPDSWKLAHYHCGIDELEDRDPYAGLLASRHYAAFFEHAADADALAFLARERSRQARLLEELGVAERDVARDVRVVQFLDKLSLYVCLSHPRCGMGPVVPWLRGPFRELESVMGEPIDVQWVGPGRIRLKPFPFRAAFACDVPLRRVDKRQIAAVGIAKAYGQAAVERERVTMAPTSCGTAE
ncbi:DUF3891 family protein [Alicyclobacillus sendaiensis]|uniref:DUF3891 family protein n=1 Tax=Alicyclobacillus sendaiensis TaxID=192387 RepID=UPI0026F42258|nr:DUF3891 family protein [Alicyclobacillus sendaiensis]